MKTFTMTGKEYTPQVLLDASKGLIEISGKSFPEDAARFYKPILKWVDEYLNSPNEITYLNFSFNYFNTSSAKKILELIKKVGKLAQTTNKLEITWCYEEGDEDMFNAGNDYSSVVDLPFKIIEIKNL